MIIFIKAKLPQLADSTGTWYRNQIPGTRYQVPGTIVLIPQFFVLLHGQWVVSTKATCYGHGSNRDSILVSDEVLKNTQEADRSSGNDCSTVGQNVVEHNSFHRIQTNKIDRTKLGNVLDYKLFVRCCSETVLWKFDI